MHTSANNKLGEISKIKNNGEIERILVKSEQRGVHEAIENEGPSTS